MEIITGLISAFGLSSSAGLNAYIPLLLVGVLSRFEVLKLSEPFNLLGSWPVLGVLSVLLLIELFADKIPGIDHVNDVVQTVVRPAAGAVLFASQSGVVKGIDPAIGLAIGLVVALGVHGAKAVTRPIVNAGTMGVGAPFVSVAEDIVAATGSVLAIFLPFVFIFFVLILAFVIWRAIKLVRTVKRKLA